MSHIIYHITALAEWQAAQHQGFYETPSLHTEGFIHCSEEHQIPGVLQRYFAGKGPLVRLTIDSDRLHARMQRDFSASLNEHFPHIYGRINLGAVIEAADI